MLKECGEEEEEKQNNAQFAPFLPRLKDPCCAKYILVLKTVMLQIQTPFKNIKSQYDWYVLQTVQGTFTFD